MQVTASTTSAATTSNAKNETDAKNNTLDYNAFLTLLITQMKNQDPLNPQDPDQYVSQLASFSGVEQGVKTNV